MGQDPTRRQVTLIQDCVLGESRRREDSPGFQGLRKSLQTTVANWWILDSEIGEPSSETPGEPELCLEGQDC